MRRWLEPVTHDVGYALRSFRRTPGFTIVALLSLTLGHRRHLGDLQRDLRRPHRAVPVRQPGEIWAPEVRARRRPRRPRLHARRAASRWPSCRRSPT